MQTLADTAGYDQMNKPKNIRARREEWRTELTITPYKALRSIHRPIPMAIFAQNPNLAILSYPDGRFLVR
jgi:hypothetical protein